MRIVTTSLFIPAVFALSLLTGCATIYTSYQDPSVSPSQVATISGESERGAFWVGKTVYIMKVDGKNVYGWWNFGDPSTRRDVRVLAGKHDLEVRYVFSRTCVDERLELVAEGGRTYTIKTDVRGDKVCFWIAVDGGRKTTQEDGNSKSPKGSNQSPPTKL